MSYLTQAELNSIGFLAVGKKVRLSNKASIYNPGKISLGDNCRIDDFVILSAGEGGISIGSYVHISTHSILSGQGKITIKDFSAVSSHCSIFSSNDDYSGHWMTNPCVPEKYTNVTHADVLLGKHVIVGSHTVTLPGCVLCDGCAIGAQSLILPFTTIPADWIYAGIPARPLKPRNTTFRLLESNLLRDVEDNRKC